MSRLIQSIAALGPWVALGCHAPELPATTREWAPVAAAIDLDPDPHVVEVELVAEVATVEFVPGISTEVWAYRDAGDPDGSASVPGPRIEVEVGDRLVVHLRNELPESTTLHWHGLRVPEAMDGNPMASGTIAVGTTTTVDFVVRDPGLHWYHSHRTADVQTQRGLQGVIVVREPDEDAALERVLVLDDIGLDADGEIVIEPVADDIMLGRRGNTLLVNGRVPGTATAQIGTIERWRLVNTSNGRYFALALPGARFTVTGWDNGPVEVPYAVDELVIAPGERYDVRVPIGGAPGDHLVLSTLPYARGEGMEDPGPYTLLDLELRGKARPAPSVRTTTRTIERLDAAAATTTRRFELAHDLGVDGGAVFTINGKRWPLAPEIRVGEGDIEIWEIVDDTGHEHPFHLHGFPFQVLDRDGVPEPTLGWKDTVRVRGRGTTRLLVRHEAPGMWMFHCSIPEHAERGMMSDLHVTAAPR